MRFFDRLYDKFFYFKTGKDTWHASEKGYDLDNATRISHLSIEFENYKMVHGVHKGEQIHTFQDYLSAVEKCGTVYNDSHIVSILLKKLPPSWSDFANGFTHKIDSLDRMGVYNTIIIKEANQTFIKSVDPHKDQIYSIEHSDSPKSSHSSPKNRQFFPKGKLFKAKSKSPHCRPQNPQHPKSSVPKTSEKNPKHCFACGKTNHITRDCFFWETKSVKKSSSSSKPQVNVLKMGASSSGTHFRSKVEDV